MHVPSYGRTQNLRLCPPLSARLSFKPISRIIFLPPFHCCKKSWFFVLKGLRPPHAPQRKAEHAAVPGLPELPRSALRAAAASTHLPPRRAQPRLCSVLIAPRTRKWCRRYTAFIVYLCVSRGRSSPTWVREHHREKLNIKVMERRVKSSYERTGQPYILFQYPGNTRAGSHNPRAVRGGAAVLLRGLPAGKSGSSREGQPAPSHGPGLMYSGLAHISR